ncbi:hypothetical protein B0H10DRAFT_1938434 [Mycena sp. CBHHK59/15]|nr:hypothetical protein B0H10DRAFT_1938434 [Mycena sp. CBHHK59/15]
MNLPADCIARNCLDRSGGRDELDDAALGAGVEIDLEMELAGALSSPCPWKTETSHRKRGRALQIRAGQHVLRAITGLSRAAYPDCRLTDIAAHERTGREGVMQAGGSVTAASDSLTTAALQAMRYTARSPFVHLVFEGADDRPPAPA